MPDQNQADSSAQSPVQPPLGRDNNTDGAPRVSLEGLRTRPVRPAPSSTDGIDLAGLRTRTVQQAQGALPQPQITPPWEDEPRLPSTPTTKLGQAYADARAWLSKHEEHLSEEYLRPFRRGLDKMADEIESSPYVKASGPTAKGFAYSTAELLRQTPVRENAKETVLANINPEVPESNALSKELRATERIAPNLEGLRTREVSPAPQKSPFRIAAETPEKHAEFHDAVQNTEGAKLTDKGLTLDVVRHQKPEQAGERAIRTGVFFLPEKKSPYQRYYTTGRVGYGGTQRIEGRTTYENPIIAKGASGGKVPERAYDAINGQGAYDEMRQDVLDATVHGWSPRNDAETVQRVANVLEQYGGNPDLAEEIVRNSKEGNTLPYAVQEHIVASAVRKAGHDGIIGYSKVKGQHRLSEVFDLRHDKYPISSELFESKYQPKNEVPSSQTELPASVEQTPESKARERAANLKGIGIGLTEMEPEDAKNWVGYTNQKSFKVYRGVSDPAHTIQAGDFVTTSKDAAQNYGKHVQEIEVSPSELRYVRGHKDGDPLKLDEGGQTELIYAPKSGKKERRAGVGGYSGDSPTESQFVQKVTQGAKDTETWAPADMGDGGKAWLDKDGKYIPQDKEHQNIAENFWNGHIRIGNLEGKGPLLVHSEGAPNEAQRKAIAADIKKQGGAIYDLKKDGNNVTGEAKTVGDFLRAIDSTWKPAPRKSLADQLFESAGERLQGGHVGGGVASVEELARPGRFVKISKSGMPTDQGKTPDFNLKAGEAGYQVKPDGTWELKAGQESSTTKAGVQNWAREVYGQRTKPVPISESEHTHFYNPKTKKIEEIN